MDRKLKLTVEELEVKTFETSETEAQVGTVNANVFITQLPGCVPGCNTRLTCSTNLC
ncbi:MAG TPA: hypothetical protein VF092_14730 [Longimicrobium sp.]